MKRPVLLTVLIAVASCRSAESDPRATPPSPAPSPTADEGATDEPKVDPDPQGEPRAPAQRSFEEELAALEHDGLDALPKAAALYRSGLHFEDAADPATARAQALQALLAFGDEIAFGVEDKLPFEAACERSTFCGGTPPTPEQNDALDEFERRGLKAAYGGEGTFMFQGDVAWWKTQLDDALSPGERAWLETMVLEQRASEFYDEDGYGGPVDVLADVALAYERLRALDDPAYNELAEAGACGAQAALLLSCDHANYETPACSIKKSERAQWTAMVKANPGTTTAAVSSAFLKAIKAQRYRASSDALHAVVARLLPACVEP